jgi:hypothetical protein
MRNLLSKRKNELTRPPMSVEMEITQSFRLDGTVDVHADIFDLTADEAEKLVLDLGQKCGCEINKE